MQKTVWIESYYQYTHHFNSVFIRTWVSQVLPWFPSPFFRNLSRQAKLSTFSLISSHQVVLGCPHCPSTFIVIQCWLDQDQCVQTIKFSLITKRASSNRTNSLSCAFFFPPLFQYKPTYPSDQSFQFLSNCSQASLPSANLRATSDNSHNLCIPRYHCNRRQFHCTWQNE